MKGVKIMNRLKELRKEKKLTQKELADIIGTTKLTISNWENGKHSMNSDKAQIIADFFGVSLGFLLGSTDDATRYDDEEVFQVHIEGLDGTYYADSSKRNYNERQKETKKRFINFINKNGFLISDFEIDAVFNLLSEMDLGNPNTKKHAHLFNKFAQSTFIELEQLGYSEIGKFHFKSDRTI